ncbi:MAG: beta-N-acetylhexosaminidase [Cellulosilyticaceae bacterium]
MMYLNKNINYNEYIIKVEKEIVMYLIPSPKECVLKEGVFRLTRNTRIVLDSACGFEDLEAALCLQTEVAQQLGITIPIHKQFVKGTEKDAIVLKRGNVAREAYVMKLSDGGAEITGGGGAGLFYGVQTLRQIIRQEGTRLPALEIEDEPYFEHRGYYHDITRGKVPTLETLKELVDRAAFYKINQLQLYIEHTFAFDGMSEVWVDKDPITAEEILLLDAYCQQRHVELIPSLATFGHLYEVLRTKSFEDLCELEDASGQAYSFVDRMAHHTLDATDPRSMALVKKMLEQFIPLFSSKQFNICCDETFDLGKGKTKQKAEEIGEGKLYTAFLNQVIEIVKGYDRQVMFWGDIILHHPELLAEIPEDVTCLTWNYCAEADDWGVATIAASGRKQYVCPGVGGWSMLMNLIENGFSNIQKMVAHGVKHGAIGVLNTDWGDYGHVNLLANSMPGMIYGGALSWNPKEQKTFDQMYQAISKVAYGDESETLVSLLHHLSSQQATGWYELVRWKEIDEVIGREVSLLVGGYKAACEVEEKLLELMGKVKCEPLDMEEFLSSARGVRLVHAFAIKLRGEALGECTCYQSEQELAEAFEEWLYGYQRIWRERNKESELSRIREVIASICRHLRQKEV